MKIGNLELYWPNILIFAICLFWAFLMFFAPLSQPPDTIDLGDEGIVHPKPDLEEKYQHIDNYLIRRVYESGDRNCHQHGSRSIYILGNEMPYCSRCVAIFVGMAVGAFIAMVHYVRVDWKWVVAGLIPMGIDGSIQLVTSYESNNILRILTGFPAGLITTLALGGVLFEVSKVWQEHRKEKTQELKERGLKPKVPYWAIDALIISGILILLSGLVVADYVAHNGYNDDDEETALELVVVDADHDPNDDLFTAGQDVYYVQHTGGTNIDWEHVDAFVKTANGTFPLKVETLNDENYNKYTNHIMGEGDQAVLELESGIFEGPEATTFILEKDGKTIFTTGPITVD